MPGRAPAWLTGTTCSSRPSAAIRWRHSRPASRAAPTRWWTTSSGPPRVRGRKSGCVRKGAAHAYFPWSGKTRLAQGRQLSEPAASMYVRVVRKCARANVPGPGIAYECLCRLAPLPERARQASGKAPSRAAGGVRVGNREPAYNAGSDTHPAARGAKASHDDPARYRHPAHTGYPG